MTVRKIQGFVSYVLRKLNLLAITVTLSEVICSVFMAIMNSTKSTCCDRRFIILRSFCTYRNRPLIHKSTFVTDSVAFGPRRIYLFFPLIVSLVESVIAATLIPLILKFQIDSLVIFEILLGVVLCVLRAISTNLSSFLPWDVTFLGLCKSFFVSPWNAQEFVQTTRYDEE